MAGNLQVDHLVDSMAETSEYCLLQGGAALNVLLKERAGRSARSHDSLPGGGGGGDGASSSTDSCDELTSGSGNSRQGRLGRPRSGLKRHTSLGPVRSKDVRTHDVVAGGQCLTGFAALTSYASQLSHQRSYNDSSSSGGGGRSRRASQGISKVVGIKKLSKNSSSRLVGGGGFDRSATAAEALRDHEKSCEGTTEENLSHALILSSMFTLNSGQQSLRPVTLPTTASEVPSLPSAENESQGSIGLSQDSQDTLCFLSGMGLSQEQGGCYQPVQERSSSLRTDED